MTNQLYDAIERMALATGDQADELRWNVSDKLFKGLGVPIQLLGIKVIEQSDWPAHVILLSGPKRVVIVDLIPPERAVLF